MAGTGIALSQLARPAGNWLPPAVRCSAPNQDRIPSNGVAWPADSGREAGPASGPPTEMKKDQLPSRATGPLTCTYLVAGAGFEPATSGL